MLRWLLQSERDRERSPLRYRKLVRDLAERRLEQVDERAQRERHLDLDTTRDEHTAAGFGRRLESLTSQRGLADSRPATKHDAATSLVHSPQNPAQPSHLGLTADQLERQRLHPRIVAKNWCTGSSSRCRASPDARAAPPAHTRQTRKTPETSQVRGRGSTCNQLEIDSEAARGSNSVASRQSQPLWLQRPLR